MSYISVGIIGAGSISQYHCEAIEKLGTMKLAAVSSRNRERAQKLAARFSISKVYTDFNELLSDSEIDAVVIATPTFTHHDIIIKALEHGKHVFCEKPPALTADETRECADTAVKAGKVLMFGMVCRFSGRIVRLKEMIADGRIGDIYYCEAVRTKAVSRLGGWFSNRTKAGGGELFDGCIHEIDQVLYLMGYPKPKYVSAMWSHENSDLADRVTDIGFDWVSAEGVTEDVTVETLASAMIHFENGSALQVKSGRAMFIDKPEQGYTLLGTKGGIKFDNDGCRFTTIDDAHHIVTSKVDIPDLGGAFENEFSHFADCCLNGTECICSNEEAVMLMKILNAIYQSAESGEPVFIK